MPEETEHPAEAEYSGEWEMVDTLGGLKVHEFRQRVPGGWLVLTQMEGSASTVFLPDPSGAWNPPIKKSRKRSDFF